jgi:hypothetical protein
MHNPENNEHTTLGIADKASLLETILEPSDKVAAVVVVDPSILWYSARLAGADMLSAGLETEAPKVEPFAAAIASYHLVLLAIRLAANTVELGSHIPSSQSGGCSELVHRRQQLAMVGRPSRVGIGRLPELFNRARDF